MEPATQRPVPVDPVDAYAQFVDLLDEVVGIPADAVNWDSDLRNDLGVDSLQMQDLAIICERRFGIEILEEDLPSMRTVRQVVGHVCGTQR